MVETIAPVVYGSRARYRLAIVVHTLSATATGALFGAALGLIGWIAGAPWGTAAIVVIVAGMVYAARELLQLPIPIFDRKRQVPDWWRTFYGPLTTAGLYGAGLGIGFLTFLRHGTYVVVCAIALVSGDPLVGAALGAAFGAARGASALVASSSPDSDAAAQVVHRLEGIAETALPRVVNGLACLALAGAAVAI